MAEYIDTAPHIFEVCCIRLKKTTCNVDAKVCVAAHIKDKMILYLPVCTDPSHINDALKIQEQLEKGINIRKIPEVDIQEVFIKHRHQGLKCKLTQWEEDQRNEKKKRAELRRKRESEWEEPEEPSRPPVLPPNQELIAVDYWEWIDDVDVWMDVTGNVIRIKKLGRKEFVSAVSTICAVNLSRITKKNAWVKQFRSPTPEHTYPTGAMKVGAKRASEKLEEFYEAAETNKWL